MKKLLTQVLGAMTFILAINASYAQCNYTITTSDSTICLGDSTVLIAQGAQSTLLTTLASGNNHRGNMFDIVALNAVTITSFDAHPMGNTTIEIYYKIGGYSGFENNAAAWTLVGSAPVIALPQGTATPVPVNVGITIPAGQTYAFYVTSSNVAVSLNYTNGTTAGNVYSSDANIQFLEGVGIEYPFSGGAFSPRIWNGNIHYEIPLSYTWNTGDTTNAITVSPAVGTDYWVTITDSLNGCSNVDSIFVDVNVPVFSLPIDTSICSGDSLVLDAGTWVSYLWNTGDSTQTIIADTAGIYMVDVTNGFGCTATDDIVISITPVAVAGFSTVTGVETATFTNTSTGATSWLWDFGDSNTSTLQDPTHPYAVGGSYVVTLIAYGPCGSDTITTTIDVDLDVTGLVDNNLDHRVRTYPNPNNGQFTIELNSVSGHNVHITLYDNVGSLVFYKVINSIDDTYKLLVDKSDLAIGIYFIEVSIDTTLVRERIVVQ